MPKSVIKRYFIFAALFLAFLVFILNREKGFIDIIKSSGILSEQTYAGVSWGDYNNDGYQDLLARKISRYALYRNNGDETFTDVSQESGFLTTGEASSATFADYNNDGCSDIFVTNAWSKDNGTLPLLYRNNCDGTFDDATSGAGLNDRYHARGVAWGDYNKDGFLDIYVATFGILNFIKTDTSWTFTDWTAEPNLLYRSNGDGSFTEVAQRAGVSGPASCKEYKSFQQFPREKMKNSAPGEKIDTALKDNWQAVWLDHDNDSWPDLFVSNETTINALFRNNGDGSFTDTTERAGLCQVNSTHGVAVGDYDNDGDQDIFTSGSLRNIFWRNNGDGTFTEVSEDTGTANFGLLGWSSAFFDYDNDGWLDLYSLNGTSGNASWKNAYPNQGDNLFKNNGDGTFTDVASKENILDNSSETFGAFADFNNDGFTDIFAQADSGINQPSVRGRLYKNTPNGNNWLTIKLLGTKSNKEGVGARIMAQAGEVEQMREVISGSSLLSQNSIFQTFGLGRSKTVDTLTVRWPSGTVQVLHGIRANQILTITEE